MVMLGFRNQALLRGWLDGIEPAWTLLTFSSLCALQRGPSQDNCTLRLQDDLSDDDVAASAVARCALALLARAASGGGLALTPHGRLEASIVGEMMGQFEWPGADEPPGGGAQRSLEEPDCLPLFFVRREAQAARLVRVDGGKLISTRRGRELLAKREVGRLHAMLFHTTFWRDDLGFLGRRIHGSWPQSDIGVLLWSLGAAALHWRSPAALTRLCAIPDDDVIRARWDTASLVMEARILRPLVWFGLLECRPQPVGPGVDPRLRGRAYRKSTLFDRFLSFDVRVEDTEISRH